MTINFNFQSVVVFFIFAFVLALQGCGGGGTAGNTGTTTSGSTTVVPTCNTTSLPGVPSISGVYSGNSLAVVGFSGPVQMGGTAIPISGYKVRSNPGNFEATGTSIYAPITVAGLTNGTSYTFTVQAVNCFGVGPESSPSDPITPSTVPDTPTGVVATPANGQASITFNPPAYDGGAPITWYTVAIHPGGQILPDDQTVMGTSSPILVSGLQNGTSYTFTVSANNSGSTPRSLSNGNGPMSEPSVPITPSVVPAGAPTTVTVKAGNSQASVAFTPSSSSPSPITGYIVTSSPGGITANGTNSPIAISGLNNGVAYTFTVTAFLQDGSSAASLSSNSVIPISNPGPYFVDPVIGLNTNPGTPSQPFKTITHALAVSAGVGTANTIYAAAGTYNGITGETFPLRMVNNVDLIGAGSSTTVISGADSFETSLVLFFNVTSNMSGFTLRDVWQVSGSRSIMVAITGGTVTLSNNVIIGSLVSTDGVWVTNGANATLIGNNITGTGWNRGYGALVVWGVWDGITRVKARSNTFTGIHDTVISVTGAGMTNSPSPIVDFGTDVDPGNNIINVPVTSVGIDIRGISSWVNASGNTWRANVQGSDSTGSYAVGTIGENPTPLTAGNNYVIGIDLSGIPSLGLQF